MMTAPLHFLSPERPRISGLPAFRPDLNPAGLSIIPGLYFSPASAHSIEISGFFFTGRNACSRRVIELPVADFTDFWSRWMADPEGVAEREFGWRPLASSPIAPTDTLSLDDLLGEF